MKKKFGLVTGTRAEYGLLYPLIKLMEDSSDFDFHLIVTGCHLMEHHGKTLDLIKADKVTISSIVDMKIKGDREKDICNAIAIGLEGFSKLFSEHGFDAIIILGDRYELWSVCMAAVIYKIPIIHINGGELTQGLIDDPIRHSITKMTSIHFPSIEIYRKRIIQMGEQPDSVYTVGGLFMDVLKNIHLLNIDELSAFTDVDFHKEIALMTYHPVTLDDVEQGSVQMKEILEALLETSFTVLITMPNADTGNSEVYDMIMNYSNKYQSKFILRKNLGQKGYLSAVKHCKLMIGNSSSAITESVPFRIPVVNIGDRQAGRFKSRNIIDCKCTKEDVLKTINRVTSEEFMTSINELDNPYGDGNTADRIVAILKTICFKDKTRLLKKGFYDLDNVL